MRGRAKPSAVTVLLVAAHLILATPASLLAQCRPTTESPAYTAGYIGSDGKRHIRVAVLKDPNTEGGDVTNEMRDAWADALAAWNDKSGTTNIVFDPVGPNETHDFGLRMTDDSDLTGNCMVQLRHQKYVNYDPAYCHSIAENNYAAMVRGMKHEIGHFLGMEHGATPMMTRCTADPPNCESCITQTQEMGDADAAKVVDCFSQKIEEYDTGEYYDETEEDYTEIEGSPGYYELCITTLRVWTTVSCTGYGCDESTRVEDLGTECHTVYQ